MEEAVKAFAQEGGLTLPIAGKGEGLFSRLYEFDPAMVRRVMAGYFGAPAHGKPTARPVGRTRNPPAAAQPLRRLLPSSHLLRGQKSRRGRGNHLSHGHRLLHPGFSAPVGHGRLSHLHGLVGEHGQRIFQGHGQKSDLLHRRLDIFSLGPDRSGQRRLQQPQLHPGHPGQRHDRNDRPPTQSRGLPSLPQGTPVSTFPSKGWSAALGVATSGW